MRPSSRLLSACAAVALLVLPVTAGAQVAGVQVAGAQVTGAEVAGEQTERPPVLELVESAPDGTTLNSPDVPDARDEWLAIIGNATETIDWAAFYVSGQPGSSLDNVLLSLEDAAHRGVAIRLMADQVFYETYPDILLSLHEIDGVEVRLIDYRALVGGVMHAKYFVVDGDEAYIGSQNFDWRALDHIVEMGLHVRLPAYARALHAIFERDWSRSYIVGTEPPETASEETASEETSAGGDAGVGMSVEEATALGIAEPATIDPKPIAFTSRSGRMVTLYPAFSPRSDLPNPSQWDLPRLVELLDAARDSLHATMLTYKPVERDGTYWPPLENALRRAAARGVSVRLLVADWGKRSPTVDYLQSLESVPGVEVRFVTIPQSSDGFIPFARVTHAKYAVVDGSRFWLGTGNWERSYFETSRNVGVVADDADVAAQLDRCFNRVWESTYAYTIDPCATYEVPRIGD